MHQAHSQAPGLIGEVAGQMLRRDDQVSALNAPEREAIAQRFTDWSEQGYRVLGFVSHAMPDQPHYSRDDEKDMTIRGFLRFFDPPEPGDKDTIATHGSFR